MLERARCIVPTPARTWPGATHCDHSCGYSLPSADVARAAKARLRACSPDSKSACATAWIAAGKSGSIASARRASSSARSGISVFCACECGQREHVLKSRHLVAPRMPDQIHDLAQSRGLSEEEIAGLSQPQSEHVVGPLPQNRRIALSSQRRLATKPGVRGGEMSAAARIPRHVSAAALPAASLPTARARPALWPRRRSPCAGHSPQRMSDAEREAAACATADRPRHAESNRVRRRRQRLRRVQPLRVLPLKRVQS